MFRSAFLIILFLIANKNFGQNSLTTTLRFDEESFDFGNVKISTTVSHDFYFTNTGKNMLTLKKVAGSCGCTTPEWDSLPIAPGMRGKITVVFNAFPLEKSFEKSITVESNAEPNLNYLEIKGFCIDAYKVQKARYKEAIGRLNFENIHIDFDKVNNNVTQTQRFINFYNNSEDTIMVDGFNTPVYILCASAPSTILPHQEGMVIINYNASLNQSLGFKLDKIMMVTNDRDYPKKQLAVSADIIEYFDTSIQNKAVLFLKENQFEFGLVKPGEIKTHIFELKNIGTDTLFIRKIQTTCGCTEAILGSDKIAPEGTSKLKITYHTSGAIKGVNNKPITIISTDRKNPVISIGVSVVVN